MMSKSKFEITNIADLVFQSSDGEEKFHQRDLIKLEPFGISFIPDSNRPFLLLRDKTEKYNLPVFLNPLEAGVALAQSNKTIAPVTPHKFVRELMKSLDVSIKQCVFVQVKGLHQYVRLYLQGHPKTNSIKIRADEVMSLLMEMNIPIYATKKLIESSKVLNVQLEEMSQNLPKSVKIPGKNQNYIQ